MDNFMFQKLMNTKELEVEENKKRKQADSDIEVLSLLDDEKNTTSQEDYHEDDDEGYSARRNDSN